MMLHMSSVNSWEQSEDALPCQGTGRVVLTDSEAIARCLHCGLGFSCLTPNALVRVERHWPQTANFSRIDTIQ